jgi:hypothetical protein
MITTRPKRRFSGRFEIRSGEDTTIFTVSNCKKALGLTHHMKAPCTVILYADDGWPYYTTRNPHFLTVVRPHQ